jgi:hypothetical protein
MPSDHHGSSSGSGVSRSNIFVGVDPDELRPAPPAVQAPEAVVARRFGAARQRGPGLVVPVVDECFDQAATRGVSNVARKIRSSTSVGAMPRAARDQVRRADRNAQRLLGRLAARPHGALSALIAVAALLLAVSWLGFSLRATAAARDHAQQQQRAAAVAFEQAHRRLDTLTAQPVRGAGAAGAARRQQAAAAAAARWRARAVADRPQQARWARHRHDR